MPHRMERTGDLVDRLMADRTLVAAGEDRQLLDGYATATARAAELKRVWADRLSALRHDGFGRANQLVRELQNAVKDEEACDMALQRAIERDVNKTWDGHCPGFVLFGVRSPARRAYDERKAALEAACEARTAEFDEAWEQLAHIADDLEAEVVDVFAAAGLAELTAVVQAHEDQVVLPHSQRSWSAFVAPAVYRLVRLANAEWPESAVAAWADLVVFADQQRRRSSVAVFGGGMFELVSVHADPGRRPGLYHDGQFAVDAVIGVEPPCRLLLADGSQRNVSPVVADAVLAARRRVNV